MKNIEISIVMPLYNAEKYLEECLHSVLGQTFTEFELICVNDASEDSTLQIIQGIHHKDNRIKILSNDIRRGAAYSRNRGMQEAVGKYLAFLDGDDLFDETMLERAYNKIEEKDADIVMYEFRHVTSKHIHKKVRAYHSEEYIKKYCERTFSAIECAAYEFILWSSAPWNKLYKKEFIEKNRIVFQDLPCANDVYFVIMALMLANKLVVLETENIMVYARDHSERGRISYDRNPMCTYEALMRIGEELIQRKMFRKEYSCFYYRVFFLLQSAILADKKIERAREFYYFLQKEGIQNICSLDKCFDDTVEQYLQKEFKKFLDKDFDSGWYKENNILTIFLYKKSAKVIGLYERLRVDGKKIAIWGAGRHGETLIRFFLQYGLSVEAIIDKSEDKCGNTFYGYIVVSPREILDKVQAIVISTRFIYDDVIREVNNESIEIIDINQFLCLY